MKTEKRILKNVSTELATRAAEEPTGEKYMEGYAALYNHPSKLIVERHEIDGIEGEVEFYEVIEPGAFDDVLGSENLNVLHTINHNSDHMIGRTTSGTLKLSTDELGLRYRVLVPNVTYANDAYEHVKLRNFYESSFVFAVDDTGQRWERKLVDGKEVLFRYLTRINGLYDTATVTDGAYSQTVVVARSQSLQDILKEKVTTKPHVGIETEQMEIEIFLLKSKQLSN
jgi:HK97 family phage prohead protease